MSRLSNRLGKLLQSMLAKMVGSFQLSILFLVRLMNKYMFRVENKIATNKTLLAPTKINTKQIPTMWVRHTAKTVPALLIIIAFMTFQFDLSEMRFRCERTNNNNNDKKKLGSNSTRQNSCSALKLQQMLLMHGLTCLSHFWKVHPSRSWKRFHRWHLGFYRPCRRKKKPQKKNSFLLVMYPPTNSDKHQIS